MKQLEYERYTDEEWEQISENLHMKDDVLTDNRKTTININNTG